MKTCTTIKHFGIPECKAPMFWTRVSMSDSDRCWEWNGTIHANGYGMFKTGGRMYQAHRVSFYLNGGTTDACKPLVLHSCHNRRCVNPAHLRAGTTADNTMDKVIAQRQAKGTDCHTSKLNPSDIPIIRSMVGSGLPKVRVAECFGVTPQTIRSIYLRTIWKHIP